MTSTQGHRLPAELVIAALLATALNVAAHFVQISSPLLRGRHSGRPAQAGSWRRGCQLRPQRRRRDPKQLRSPFGQPPVPRARHRNGRVPLALAVVGPMLEGRRPSPVVLVAALVVTCGAALVQGVGRSDGTGLAWAGVVLPARPASPSSPSRCFGGTDRGVSRCTPPGWPPQGSPWSP